MVVVIIWPSPQYSRVVTGGLAVLSVVWDQMVTTDLDKAVPALAAPVYFLEGRWDYTCNYQLARSYFDVLRAPVKGFYLFDQSAHSPMFEEPKRLGGVLRHDVLSGCTKLSDEVGSSQKGFR